VFKKGDFDSVEFRSCSFSSVKAVVVQECPVRAWGLADAGGQVDAAALTEELAAEEAVGHHEAEAGAQEEQVDDPHG